jgi:hypothetical protein
MATERAWSGLGPAVDAYLARWGRADAAGPQLRRIERIVNGESSRNGDLAITDDWLTQWMIFGRSYGMPQADGTIASPMTLAGHNDGASANATLPWADDNRPVYADGATIAGREQLSPVQEGDAAVNGFRLAAREADMLFDAIPHYVSADIVNEVNEAVVTMEPEVLFPTDIITPAGFAVLEVPFLTTDLNPDTGDVAPGVHNAVRAIGWRVNDGIAGWNADTGRYEQRGGVDLFLYTSVGDYLEVYVPSLREQLAIDAAVPPGDWRNDVRNLLTIDVAPWSFGTSWVPRRNADHAPGTVIHSIGEIRRWFLAFMRLCWQENIIRTRHDDLTDRPTRRRWERERPGTNLDLQVLRLRRNVYPDAAETGTGSPLGYRVKVRGFWRRQWYPSLGQARLPDGSMNPESHRLVWIEEHWRGPEDGDIRSPLKATSVVR